MRISISITGVDDVLAALGKLPPRLEAKVLRQAARKVAKDVLADARANVPRDTGALAKGLKARALRGGRGRIAMRVRTPTRAELAALQPSRAAEIMSSPWYYPAAVEYGYTRKGVTRPPAAYLRRALESNRERALVTMRRELLAGLARESRALASRRGTGGAR